MSFRVIFSFDEKLQAFEFWLKHESEAMLWLTIFLVLTKRTKTSGDANVHMSAFYCFHRSTTEPVHQVSKFPQHVSSTIFLRFWGPLQYLLLC